MPATGIEVVKFHGRLTARLATGIVLLSLGSGLGEQGTSLTVNAEKCPAPQSSLVPHMTRLGSDKLALSWQVRLRGGGYAFQMAVRDGGRWSDVRTIASGPKLSMCPKLSMYGVDLPGIAQLPGGRLLAYWELKDPRGGDPFATAIQTAVSRDEASTWSEPTRPYGDALAGQHSFLSWFPQRDGVGLVWLDAQQQAKEREMGHKDMGSIGLRYAHLNAAGSLVDERFVDPITCECCPTSAAVTASGPVVVYRRRAEAPGTKPSEVREDRPTVRDIYITRLVRGEWSAPHLVHADKWVINGCPDNGPAVDSEGNAVVVAWWTRAGSAPKVEAAFSSDAGETFGQAIRVDAGMGEGQVTVALVPGLKGAVVGWLEGGKAWARYVSAAGVNGPAVALGASAGHARLPKWIVEDTPFQKTHVVAAWTEKQGDVSQVRVAELGTR